VSTPDQPRGAEAGEVDGVAVDLTGDGGALGGGGDRGRARVAGAVAVVAGAARVVVVSGRRMVLMVVPGSVVPWAVGVG
jgi:hypothetical protein